MIDLSPEDKQRPTDDDERRHQDFNDQTAGDDAVSHVARRFSDHVPIDRLNTQTDHKTKSHIMSHKELCFQITLFWFRSIVTALKSTNVYLILLL